MSSDAEEVLDDLYTMVSETQEILDTSNRDLGLVQLRIILTQKLEHLKTYINKILTGYSGDLNLRSERIFDTISGLQDIMNRIPNNEEFSVIWKNLSTYHALLLSTSINPKGLTDEDTQIQAQATMLSHLLMDVIRITDYPQMENANLTKSFFDRRRASFNAIQSHLNLYNSALSNIYLIDKNKAIKWTSEGIWYMQLFLEYHKSIDFEFLWDQEMDNYKEFYRKVMAGMIPLTILPGFLQLLYQLWGDNWPDDIETYGVIPSRDLEGIKQSMQDVWQYTNNRMNEIYTMYNEGIIDKNANPKDSTSLDLLNSSIHNMSVIIVQLDAFESYLDGKKDVKLMEKAISSTKQGLDRLLTQAGGIDKITNTSFWQTYLIILPRYITLLALSAKRKNNASIYQKAIGELTPILDKISIKTDSQLIYTLSLLRIFLWSNDLISINKGHEIKILEEISQQFKLSPQTQFSATLLQTLLQHTKNDTDLNQSKLRKKLTDKLNELGISHMSDRLDQFIATISDKSAVDIEVNIADPYSYIRPEFSISQDLPDVRFPPFNMHKDRIF